MARMELMELLELQAQQLRAAREVSAATEEEHSFSVLVAREE